MTIIENNTVSNKKFGLFFGSIFGIIAGYFVVFDNGLLSGIFALISVCFFLISFIPKDFLAAFTLTCTGSTLKVSYDINETIPLNLASVDKVFADERPPAQNSAGFPGSPGPPNAGSRRRPALAPGRRWTSSAPPPPAAGEHGRAA